MASKPCAKFFLNRFNKLFLDTSVLGKYKDNLEISVLGEYKKKTDFFVECARISISREYKNSF